MTPEEVLQKLREENRRLLQEVERLRDLLIRAGWPV
jgi:hypothetical protein